MRRAHLQLRLALLLAMASVSCNGNGPQSAQSADGTQTAEDGSLPVRLFFPAEDGRLHAELRNISADTGAEERVRQVVEGLLEGPSSAALEAPLPEGVVLDSILINTAGVAYIDLRLENAPRPPIAGSRQELLAVYSLVDSVLINVTELRSVVVLWNGLQRTSFAGHVDTSRPLLADTSYLVESP